MSQNGPEKNNWSMEETFSLVLLYKVKAAIIRGSFSANGCTADAEAKAWQDICSALAEAHPAGLRSIKECQRRWQTVQSVARANISAFIQEQARTDKSVSV